MPWPSDIPDDLRDRLTAVLSQRGIGPAEIWTTLEEYLEEIGADAPGDPPHQRGATAP